MVTADVEGGERVPDSGDCRAGDGRVAFPAADMPADLRDLVDKQVVAKWKHRPGNRDLTFYSSGKFTDGTRNIHGRSRTGI